MTATPDRAPAVESPTPAAGARTTPGAVEGAAPGTTPATAAARGAAVAGQTPRAGTEASTSSASPRPKRRNKSGQIGTATETAVVRFLQANGWPHAERRRLKGAHDQGDITGTPGICWEVKGGEAARRASDALIFDWFNETERERQNAGADVGILVVARAGIGPANAERWWAIVPYVTAYCLRSGGDEHAQPECWDSVDDAPVRMLLGDLVALLRASGFGTPLPGGEAA